MRYRALRGTGTTITTLFSNNLFWEKKKNRINMISPLDENTNQITHIFKKKNFKKQQQQHKNRCLKNKWKKNENKKSFVVCKNFLLEIEFSPDVIIKVK